MILQEIAEKTKERTAEEKNRLPLPAPSDVNLFKADAGALAQYRKLPSSLKEACELAAQSTFLREHLPQRVLDIYCNR